jgi:hypothetical protein
MTKKKGGMFNSYQTSPLHQGYGTHYATIWVGTPPQRQANQSSSIYGISPLQRMCQLW